VTSPDSMIIAPELPALPVPGSSTAILEAYEHSVLNTYGTPKRVFTRGEGCFVWDADGRRHLDLLSGLAVTALGHAHPTVLAAITGQLATLGHVSNFFATPAQVALAGRLTELTAIAPRGGAGGSSPPESTQSPRGGAGGSSPPGSTQSRVFFTNSGTEANEAAFKITRMTGRTKIIACEGAFHGRSMGALALTHNPKYRDPFMPLPGEVVFVPYGDADALAAAADDGVAAIVLEPIQGENGVVVPPAGYLAAAREIADRNGALLWIDEVQTGIGRTGSWLVHVDEGVRADIVTVAKGLGNGFPIGACLASGPAAGLLGPGSHGSTFGGNPVAAIAGLAVIAVIERDGLLANATAMGEHLVESIIGLGHPLITGVRGRGLLRGVTLTEPVAPAIADAALDAGFVINAPRPDVLRLAPPLVITAELLDTFVAVLPGLLDDASARAAA
jgi:acetylornithine/N-succinyldiaminopimelate aminotransferase